MNAGAERSAAAVPPQGVVTFLFTDIEGSTRRWDSNPAEMRTALETHDAVLRDAIEAHRGRLFKHTGDGVCAAFASPSAAVDAAVAGQRALELPVRMGIATGEAELRGGDYFGVVLNRAARVMAAGHGGQILLDGATAMLINGFDLVELGPRRLRDLAKPIELFQVQAQGLRAEFPALRTLDPTPGNLRPPTTSFVGRESELGELEALLKANRLVTLTGVGGVGKTRLAIEVAARVAHRFLDGVWIIELAAVGDPAAVPEAVAAVLGITQQPGMTLAESISVALEGRERLLVFDNCEHVLDAAAEMVEAIFTRSATVHILATSREGLRVADEQLWPVPSLAVDSGADSAAAILFSERAAAVAPDFVLARAKDADAVVEICRRLDGIPLAIELAASRLQSMTVAEVRDRLDDRFRLLIGSRRSLERHQTLRHAVQWSYELLDDAEKALLNRCSVFAGGFDLDGARAVGGCADDFAALDLLDALVRKSLLAANRASDLTRFTMLETIRQFAEEQLVASGEADDSRQAHARYFAGREADVLALWDGPQQREAYTWFVAELANLRAAFRWAADHDDLDTAAAIALYGTFLGCLTEQYEPVGWAEELIEPAKAVEHSRLAQLYVMAAQCYAAGRLDEFAKYSEAGQAAILSGLFDDVDDNVEASLAGGYATRGEPVRWGEWCQILVERRQGPQVFARASLVVALGIAGSGDEAMTASHGLVADADATENPHVISWALLGHGIAHQETDPAACRAAHLRGIAIAHDSGNRLVESHHASSLSRFAALKGNPSDAFDYAGLAIRHFHDSGSISLMHAPLAILAVAFDRLGYYEPAATITGFTSTPFTRGTFPQIVMIVAHLRDVLGDEVYESFARAGVSMTNAAMAAYAFEQIARVRSELFQ